ncbi:MAG: TonB-dependent receptor plug domain-containing protein [Cytophagales bacterium]|nr:TonB-dependent receptor plug domain-containing protein [Cytophagales bacterium]
MNKTEILMYLLKSMILSGIFFGYYSLFLKNTIYHAYNRFYLLASMALSLVIPFFKLSMFSITEEQAAGAKQVLIYLTQIPRSPVQEQNIAWEIIVMSTISSLFVCYLVYSVLRIFRLKAMHTKKQMGEFTFIETDLDEAPFSFFSNLFWKKSISMEDESGRKILKHELAHIREKHSWDRLFSQIICSVFWMNPFNWFIQKELQNIHEFIADRNAVGAGDVDAFAKMLLQTYYSNHFLNPSHSFYYSSIKRRIIMLTTSQTPKYAYLRKVAVLPMLAFILAIFSIQLSAQKPKPKKKAEVQYTVTMRPDSTTFSDPKTGKKVFSVATKDMPPPPPPSPPAPPAAPAGPKSVLKVELDTVGGGSFSDNPIIFIAKKVADRKAVSAKPLRMEVDGVTFVAPRIEINKPLVVVDGVIVKDLDLNIINPNTIEAINVLKGDKAFAKYAEKGANGVIEIITKK